MAGSLKDLRRILRQYKAISDSSRIPGEFQVIPCIWCEYFNNKIISIGILDTNWVDQ